MEQHKVLMVIVSVTLFLAAVVGMSMYLLYPHEAETPQQARAEAEEARERFDPIEYMRRPDELPRLTLRDPDPEEDVIIVYGEREDRRVRPEDAPAEEEVVGDEALRIPEIERDPEDPEAHADPAPVEPREPHEPREPEAPAEERVTERRPEPEPEAPPAPAPAPEPEPTRERVTEYWIQVVSSPRRDTVQRARERLDQRDLGTRITTTEVNGSTFYRLRIGPHRSKPEAEKFLELVSGLDGFEESYISEEYPLRTVRQ